MQPKDMGRRDYPLNVIFLCLYLSYHHYPLLLLDLFRNLFQRKQMYKWNKKRNGNISEAEYSFEVTFLVLIVKKLLSLDFLFYGSRWYMITGENQINCIELYGFWQEWNESIWRIYHYSISMGEKLQNSVTKG